MSDNNLYRYAGTLQLNGGTGIPGELLLDESKATFISTRGAEVVVFEINDMTKLSNERHGDTSSTVAVELKSGDTLSMLLERGLPAYDFLNKRWTTRPVRQKSRADELRRQAELRGERIQKPQKSSEGRKRKFRIVAAALIAFIILLDTGVLAAIFNFVLEGLCYWVRFLEPVKDWVAQGFAMLKNQALVNAILHAVIILFVFIFLSFSFKRRHPNRSVGGDIGIYFLLIVMSLLMAFPLVFAISSSLKPLDELFRFPPTVFPRHATFDNFSDLIVTLGQSWVPFSRYLVNTVFITLVGTLGHLIIASMAAFVLAKYDFPGGRTFFAIVTTALMFTGYVTGIPNYLIMNRLGMIDIYWALLLPAFAAPIGLFLMKQFMEGLPTALIEAAHIDGAGEFRIFWSIVMPNVKPAWITVSIFSIQSLWNLSASTVIYSEAKKTLVYALAQIQAGGIARTGQAAAVTVVVMIVPIIIFIISESRILETMASSGIKD